jgi:transcriptional regulator with XRE-family HTH domain
VEDSRFLLRQDTIRRVLTRSHLTHQQFADHLGLSRSYWSQLYNRHRHLTPTLRQTLLASRYLAGLAEDELWEELPTEGGTEATS